MYVLTNGLLYSQRKGQYKLTQYLRGKMVQNNTLNYPHLFNVINITIFTVLLISYHLLVRSTPIGIFLNGKRFPYFKKKTTPSIPDLDEGNSISQSSQTRSVKVGPFPSEIKKLQKIVFSCPIHHFFDITYKTA